MPTSPELPQGTLLNPSPILDPSHRLREIEAQVIGQILQQWRHPWARARFSHVQKYLLNHAFLNGHQYIRHDGRSLVPLPRRYKNQVRLVNNVLKPIVRLNKAQLTRNKPTFDLMAWTGDYTDEATVKVGWKLLRSILYATHHRRVNSKLMLDLMKGGTAFKDIGWNDRGGATTEIPATDSEGNKLYEDLQDNEIRTEQEVQEIVAAEMEFDEEYEPAQRFRPILIPDFEGQISVDVLTVMEVLGDAANWMLEDQPVVITERAYTLDFIRSAFPERGKYVKPESDTVILFDTSGGARMVPGLEIPRVTGGRTDHRTGGQDVAVVRRVRIRPTEFCPLTGKPAPFGREFYFAGDIALTDLDNPLPFAFTPETEDHDVDFGLVKYDWFLEESFWSSDFLSDLLPLQRAFNRRRSQINESINAFVHPKLQVAIGSTIRKGSFADVAGEVVEYAGVPASYLEPPSIRPYVFKSAEMDVQQINDIAMSHEVMRQGRVPPQVRTAAGIRMLEEKDSLALQDPLELFEESEEKFGQLLLDRAKQFFESGRIISYVGKRNRLETEEFKRQPFFNSRWKVYVHRGSTFPTSRAARVAETHEMLQFFPYLLIPQGQSAPNRRLYVQMIGREDLEEYFEDIDESRQAAEAENVRLEAGEYLSPLPFEEHDVHLDIHYKYMRAPDYRELDQQLQQLFIQHVQETFQLQQQQVAAQSQAAAEMQQTAMAAESAVSRNAAAEAAGAAAVRKVDELVASRESQDQELVERPDGYQSSNALLRQLMKSRGGRF